MATGTVSRNGAGIARSASGSATGDGTPLAVTLGFLPHKVTVWNMTDGTKVEWTSDMAANTTFKQAAGGAGSVATDGAIVPMDKGFVVNAATNANGKNLVWFAN